MPYTMDDFRREFMRDFLKDLAPLERPAVLEQLAPEERLELLSSKEVLADLSPEQVDRLIEKLQSKRAPGSRKPRGRK